MSGNGIPERVMGDGEGFSTLILTNKESLLIRERLHNLEQFSNNPYSLWATELLDVFNRGIHRATARIQAEFSEEARRRKEKSK